jgi:Acetyltransferase (GNAT) domain
MAELGSLDAWPPDPIRTERLVLREPEAHDRTAVIELFSSPEVGTYLGGPRPRDELERTVPDVPRRRPGLFVVDLDAAMIGVVTIDRRDVERPGHLSPEGGRSSWVSSRWSASRSSMPSSGSACDGRKPRNPLWTRGSEPRPLSVVGA